MPNISPEFVMASAITEDPTKLVAAIPAAIVGIGAAAKSFTIVHQSEAGVRTRRGSPMLKPEVLDLVTQQVCDDLPESRIRCRSQLKQLPKDERRERIHEKLAELPAEMTEQGIYRIVGQGVVWLTPFIDRVVKINIADQTTKLEPFEMDSSDGRNVMVSAGITWNVRQEKDHPFNALFKINNEKETNLKNKTQELEQTISWITVAGLGKVLRGRNYQDLLETDPRELTAQTQLECEDDLLEYGVSLNKVWPNPVVRTPAERIAQSIETLGPDSIPFITDSVSGDSRRNLHLARQPDDAA